MLGEIHNLQDRHDAAIAMFRRALGIYEAAGMGNLVMTGSVYNGLAAALLGRGEAAEAAALLGRGEAAEAAALLKPLIAKSDSLYWYNVANTYAVASRENGEAAEAERVERMIDADKTFEPWVGRQQRGLLRARLLAGRGSVKEAGGIYQRLIAELENDQPRKEWDRPLVAPLAAYAKFLAAQGRGAEAAEVRARLQGIQKKYGIQGTIQ